MPRILAPSNSFQRGGNRSNASLQRKLWNYSSSPSLRQYQNNYYTNSSPNEARRAGVDQYHYHHQQHQYYRQYSSDGTTEEPMMISSDNSVQNEDANNGSNSSQSSSVSSLPRDNLSSFRPSAPPKTPEDHRVVNSPLHNYRPRRTLLPKTPASPINNKNNSSSSFIPMCKIQQEDVWGQFVDVSEEEEKLIRHSKLLSKQRYGHMNAIGRPMFHPDNRRASA